MTTLTSFQISFLLKLKSFEEFFLNSIEDRHKEDFSNLLTRKLIRFDGFKRVTITSKGIAAVSSRNLDSFFGLGTKGFTTNPAVAMQKRKWKHFSFLRLNKEPQLVIIRGLREDPEFLDLIEGRIEEGYLHYSPSQYDANRQDIRNLDPNYVVPPEHLTAARAFCQVKVFKALEEEQFVVVSGSFQTILEFLPYIHFAKYLGVAFDIKTTKEVKLMGWEQDKDHKGLFSFQI